MVRQLVARDRIVSLRRAQKLKGGRIVLTITSPGLNEEISSPVLVSGQASGSWFFEGSFPVEIYDSTSKLLGSGVVKFKSKSADDTWMTTALVDFQGEIKFIQPKTAEGYFLFKKDNPSGKPELEKSFKLPVKFGKAVNISSWKTYRNEKYGFEFQYPKSWKIDVSDDLLVISNPDDKYNIFSVQMENTPDSLEGWSLHKNLTALQLKWYYFRDSVQSGHCWVQRHLTITMRDTIS